MDFSTAYFGKPLNDLQYIDIVNFFIEPRQESETIEFKSSNNSDPFDRSLQIIIRGISAFLNSSGGILIWGAPRGIKESGHSEKLFVGTLSPFVEYKEKDTLINKITSIITPMPVGINVMQLASNDGYIYVFEIQQSLYKPHQFNSIYYVRLDGQTKPAPHYLVEALIKQISYPNLNGIIRFFPIMKKQDAFYKPVFSMAIIVGIFNFSELQNEENVSFRVLCMGGYFAKARTASSILHKQKYRGAGYELIYDNFIDTLHYGTPNVHEDVIDIDQTEFEKYDGKLTLSLSFGGKYSPAKSSDYILNLNDQQNFNNPNSLIEHCEENVLYAERIKRLNTTIGATLTDFSGRNHFV